MNKAPRRVVVLTIVGLVVAGVAVDRWQTAQQAQAFVRQWTQRLRPIDSLDAARRFQDSAPVFVRTFPSGDWLVATCEHSCCSGAGFDATVIRDSTGAVWADTTHTFCGIEGLSAALGSPDRPTSSLPAFYASLSYLRLQKQ